MKKLHIVLAIMVAASLLLTACGSAGGGGSDLLSAIKSRGYILVSTDPNYAPQSALNANGKRPASTKCPADALTTAEMEGFDVDVAKAIGDDLGVETCFATPSWDAITAGSWADKWDVSVGSMTITTERQKVLNFSVPYYYTPAVVAVAKDSGITSLDQLAGQSVCAGASTTYESWLNNDMTGLGLPDSSIYAHAPAGVKVVTLDTDQECAQAIAAGRKDFVGYVTSATVVDANIAAGMPVVKLGNPVYSEDLAASFDKASTLNSDSLRAEVDKLFTAMHGDGRLTALSNQWFQSDLTQAPTH
ncbi:MAG TPA: transporter substrate-binding domain-containing protein [Anaerolineales bacterium]|jgi:polar amino acid transport system substrate-binding protein|nr:transporter substrate-binding domain-containing protein [Anaerolineales bacterium]